MLLAKQVMVEMSKNNSQNTSWKCRASQNNILQVVVNYSVCGSFLEKKRGRRTRTNDKKLDIDAHVEARKSNYVSLFFRLGQEVQYVSTKMRRWRP